MKLCSLTLLNVDVDLAELTARSRMNLLVRVECLTSSLCCVYELATSVMNVC